MSKSSIRQIEFEEINFRVYNNFDVLRDMLEGKIFLKEEIKVVVVSIMFKFLVILIGE